MDPKPYIEYNPQLIAVPSIHGRLMFCVLVHQACTEYRPDVIAVELPQSLGRAAYEAWKILSGASKEYPPLLLLARIFERTSLKGDPNADYLPIGPGDSIIEAIRYSIDHDIPLSFIDYETHPKQHEKRPGMQMIEDGMLLKQGICRFSEKIREHVQKTRVTIDSFRERYMAAQLRLLLEQGKRVLFVCGAVHWEPICGLLNNPRSFSDVESSEYESIETILFHASPITFYMHCSDLPAVVLEYESLRRLGTVQNFNHERAWANIWRRVLNRLEKSDEKPSPREFMKFLDFLERLGVYTRRLHPIVTHLHHATESCESKMLSQILYEEVFRYPTSIPSSCLPVSEVEHLSIQPGTNEIYTEIDGQRLVLRSRHPIDFIYSPPGELESEVEPTAPVRVKLRSRQKGKGLGTPEEIKRILSGSEDEIKKWLKAEFKKSLFEPQSPSADPLPKEVQENVKRFLQIFSQSFSKLRDSDKNRIMAWSTDESTKQVNTMSVRARNLASVKLENLSSAESKGVYRGSLDIRRTIRMKVRGESKFYMKEIQDNRLFSNNIFEGFDPIAWVFNAFDDDRETIVDDWTPDGNIYYSTNVRYGERIPGDTDEEFCEYLGAIVLFTPDHMANEVSRLARWIRSGNQDHVPTFSPQILRCEIWDQNAPFYRYLTPEERASSFQVHEILFLAATYYARRYVIWISDRALRPNQHLREICKRQGKSLICLELNDFPRNDIEKLRNYEIKLPSEFTDWLVDELYEAMLASDLISALLSHS